MEEHLKSGDVIISDCKRNDFERNQLTTNSEDLRNLSKVIGHVCY